jgi:hypothetical protein
MYFSYAVLLVLDLPGLDTLLVDAAFYAIAVMN